MAAIGSTRQWQTQSIHDASQDWAILVLDGAPTGIRPLGIAEYAPPELKSMHGRILLPSYSHDMAQGEVLSIDPSCSIEDFKWEVLLHDCIAGAGSAGAPLLVRNQNCYDVVGIHSGSILVNDPASHGMQLVANSGIGVSDFAGQLQAIVRRLNGTPEIASVKRRSSNACSLEMTAALARSGTPLAHLFETVGVQISTQPLNFSSLLGTKTPGKNLVNRFVSQ